MIRDFFAWWIGQLGDLIPERWRRFGSLGSATLVVAPEGPLSGSVDAARISLRRNGRDAPLGRFALTAAGLAEVPHAAGKPVVLQLAETDVLAKTVTLPLTAERDLDQVLAFEMDRETPFGPEEIFWGHDIAQRDRQHGQLAVRLLLVPRASVAALLNALAEAGMIPKQAEIASGPDRGRHLPLDGEGGRRSNLSGRSALRWPSVACC